MSLTVGHYWLRWGVSNADDSTDTTTAWGYVMWVRKWKFGVERTVLQEWTTRSLRLGPVLIRLWKKM